MNSPHYTTHQRTTRAASANHTEAGASREPLRKIWQERGTPDLAPGDVVTVIDPHSKFFEKVGTVDKSLTVSKYMVQFSWSAGAIHLFKRSQLAKVERRGAPQSALMVIDEPVIAALPKPKRPDIFFCIWGRYDLSKCPEIPRRFMEHKTRQMKKKPITQPVICLPAPSPETRAELARQKFEAFMALCEREYPTSELFVQSLDNPKPSPEYRQNAKKQGKAQRSAKTRKNRRGSQNRANRQRLSKCPNSVSGGTHEQNLLYRRQP